MKIYPQSIKNNYFCPVNVKKMEFKKIILLFFCSFLMSSCIGLKDLKYVQSSENTQLNQYGLIPVTYEVYRVKKDDVLAMTLITSDENASKFLGNENTIQFKTSGGGSDMGQYRINGLVVGAEGNISIYGLGEFHVYGLTLEEIRKMVQERLDSILYNEGKAEVRINMASIRYIMLGEIGAPGEKIETNNRIDLLSAIAKAGDLTRFADRKHIKIIREYPEGKKFITLDITQEDIMNSPYFYLQSGDQIIIDPRREKITGVGGGTTIGDITQFLSLGMAAITTYFFFKSLNL